jgi:flagellar basal body-associated protein FliL
MDIVPIIPLWLKYLPWIIGIILIAAVIGGIFWWKKRKQKMEEFINIKPPHVIAEEEIQKLQSARLFEKGQYKEFYFRLSEIIRRYLEKTGNFPAAEFTTEEIARRLKSEIDRKILPLLRQADLVKFAETVPTQARKDEDVISALSYIKDTAPAPSVPGQANAVSGGIR